MKAELISIGDELLIGQTVNTNASWLGKECSQRGVRVVQVTTISDDKQLILDAVAQAFERADLVLVTGGLGPTKDDITKHTLCEFFNTSLEMHIPTLQQIEQFFSQRNRPMLDVNIRQAELPKDCEILTNRVGTAAGMWFDYNGKILISMPGVPYEMKGIMLEEVFPRLDQRFQLKSLFHKTILTQGIGESFLAESIAEWEDEVRAAGLSLAYLPAPGMVKLRLTSFEGKQREPEIDAYFAVLKDRYPSLIYGEGEETLPQVIGAILERKKWRIGTVESCTGGGLAASFVANAGASTYFSGSLLTYTNEMKAQIGNVSSAILNDFGAVSSQVAEEMAHKGREILGVDICISTTGVLGPEGGTTENPVGTVWIGVATKDRTLSKRFQYADNRERNSQMAILSALNLARCELLELIFEKK